MRIATISDRPHRFRQAYRKDTQIRDFSRLNPAGRFITSPEYPHAAWLEAIVNACAHRSYSLRGMTIFIRMFDDRLVIESPGGFPPFVTPQNIYESQHARNPYLMDALHVLDWVKCAREGAKRMRDSMNAANLPEPIFSEPQNGYTQVRVVLQNNIKQRDMYIDKDASHLVGKETYESLAVREKKVINLVAELMSVQVSPVARYLDVEWGTAKKLLMKLVDKGILIRIADANLEKTQKDPKACFILRPRATKQPKRK